MSISFKLASINDVNLIAKLVIELTNEISQLTDTKPFNIDLESTIRRCHELISEGHYCAIICFCEEMPIAVATITETYALYAGGKIGVIQEFYVTPEYRASGIGTKLIEQVKQYGKRQKWASLELCTPPLPEFERTLKFYQKSGLIPVGGRKMREDFE